MEQLLTRLPGRGSRAYHSIGENELPPLPIEFITCPSPLHGDHRVDPVPSRRSSMHAEADGLHRAMKRVVGGLYKSNYSHF